MYTEVTHREPRQRALLISPQFPNEGRGTYCLSFKYNMFGPDVGKLAIGDHLGQTLWTQIGSSSLKGGSVWQEMHLVVSNIRLFVVSGIRGGDDINDDVGDIAIDDFELHAGECKMTEGTSFITYGIRSFNAFFTNNMFCFRKLLLQFCIGGRRTR